MHGNRIKDIPDKWTFSNKKQNKTLTVGAQLSLPLFVIPSYSLLIKTTDSHSFFHCTLMVPLVFKIPKERRWELAGCWMLWDYTIDYTCLYKIYCKQTTQNKHRVSQIVFVKFTGNLFAWKSNSEWLWDFNACNVDITYMLSIRA